MLKICDQRLGRALQNQAAGVSYEDMVRHQHIHNIVDILEKNGVLAQAADRPSVLGGAHTG
eukprot:1622970-Prorocentrum_lima.AAC.1